MTRHNGSTLVPVSCALCGADDAEPRLWVDDLRHRTLAHPVQVVRCRACGFTYLTPQPLPGEDAHFYPERYEPYRRRGWMARARRLLLRREIRALWPYLAPPRRILEVGAATGDFLQLIREAGNPSVTGLEPSAQAVALARERDIALLQGTLDEARFPTGAFDTILLQHVLEHLPEPIDALRRLAGWLVPGGVLILWLPNGDSWAARCFGPAWMGYDPPRHRSVFTPRTLHQACLAAGLDIVDVHHEWHGLEWAWGLRLWASQCSGNPAFERALATVHLPLVVLFTPVGMLAAAMRRSGRIRVVARKVTSAR